MNDPYPHEQVFVRLGPSAIHGIGVFALRNIAAGTNVFPNDQRPIRWVSASELALLALPPFERVFYEDFAIRRGDAFGCPENFNLLTAGWYVNEPKPGEPANLLATPDFQLIASRDIADGEELTIVYASFSSGET
ncbi:MAG: SET domain-containing protein-lysine N-methyltransferase [Sphingomicrobium sp.]|nr:SET domain-containing protein [Sphingomonadales bacterium]